MTRGTGTAIELGRSFKLGVIRLTERFIKSDPLDPKDERKLVRHIDGEIGKYLDQVRKAPFDHPVERCRNLGVQSDRGLRIVPENGGQRFCFAVPPESRFSGDHFVEDRTK